MRLSTRHSAKVLSFSALLGFYLEPYNVPALKRIHNAYKSTNIDLNYINFYIKCEMFDHTFHFPGSLMKMVLLMVSRPNYARLTISTYKLKKMKYSFYCAVNLFSHTLYVLIFSDIRGIS